MYVNKNVLELERVKQRIVILLQKLIRTLSTV